MSGWMMVIFLKVENVESRTGVHPPQRVCWVCYTYRTFTLRFLVCSGICRSVLSVWSQMEIHIWESLEYHENWSSECGRNYLVRLCKLEREENQRQTLGKLAFKAQVEEEGLWKKLRSNQGGKPGDKGRRKWFTCSGVYTSRSFKYFWPGFFILKTKD